MAPRWWMQRCVCCVCMCDRVLCMHVWLCVCVTVCCVCCVCMCDLWMCACVHACDRLERDHFMRPAQLVRPDQQVRHCWESRVISLPIHLPLFLPAVDEPRRSCGTVHVQRDHARSASVYRTSQHTTVRTDKLIWLNNVLIHHSGFLLLSFDTVSCLHSYALHDSWNGGTYRKVGVRIKTKDLVILVS